MDEFGYGVEIELEHDVGAMSFGGVNADAEEGGDFFVGFALGEELKDFSFTRGKAGTRRLGAVGNRGGEFLGIEGAGYAGGEIGLTETEGFDGSEEDAVGVVLEDVAVRTGFDDLLNEIVGFVHGENEDFGTGRTEANAAGGINAVEKGHADIEDGYIGLEFGGFLDGVATVGSFGANCPTGA